MGLIDDAAKLSGTYDRPVPDYGDLLTRDQWLRCVKDRLFIDYDGFGSPVKGGKMMNGWIYPSQASQLPDDATHVIWFNK